MLRGLRVSGAIQHETKAKQQNTAGQQRNGADLQIPMRYPALVHERDGLSQTVRHRRGGTWATTTTIGEAHL